jgi:molecular chaperone GrpE
MKNDDKKSKKEEEVTEEHAEEANDTIGALEEKLSDFENKYKRALADYQNLQKRVNEERVEWIRSANKEILLRLLPVLDTLMLANQHGKDEGLKVSINQFLDILKAEGVTRIETTGKEFNPEVMECIVTDSGDTNKVLEELRAGYMMNEKVLRPAQVKVGKKS